MTGYAAGKPLELLERAQSLAELARGWEAAATGNGGLILLRGEAGVGKTSLVRAFAASLSSGVRILWGGCDPLSLPRPLGPLLDVAGDLGEGFQDLLREEGDRARLFSALRDALQARPTLFVVEDCHWADEASLDLLRFLGRRMEATRCLLVATYRDDEVGPRHPLRILLGELATVPGIHRLPLTPLSESAVQSLAGGTGLDAAELHRRTGGNPFFLSELLAAGSSDLPPSLQDAVLARLSRLEAPVREAIEAAAVLGSRIDPLLLADMGGVAAATLDAALASGVLQREGLLAVFRHELGREAVLAGIGPARLVELHRQALAAWRRRPLTPDDWTALAHHAEGARDAAAVLELAPAAARRAAALRSHREAAAQYDRALRFAQGLDPRAKAELLEARAYEGYLTNQIDEAIAARRQALGLWEGLGEQEKVGESHRWLSRLHWFIGQREAAEAHGAKALEVLEGVGSSLQLAHAYSNLSQLSMLAAREAEAIAWGERALALAERLEAKEVRVHALNNVGTARAQTGDLAGIAQMEASLALALELGLEEHAARAYTNLSSIAVMARRLTQGGRHLAEGLAYCAEHDLDSWTLYMRGWLAVCDFWGGRYGEAARTAEAMLRHPRLVGPSRVQPLLVLGHLRLRRGDPQVEEALDEALLLAEGTQELQRLGPVRAARAEGAWLAGDLARTRAEAEAAYPLALALGDPWLIGELGHWRWRAGVQEPPSSEAAEPYARMMRGDARGAAEVWAELGCPYEQALALSDLEDEAALREAHRLLEALGAQPLTDLVARRLRTKGVRDLPRRPRASTKANPSGLTAREVEVLRLVAEGLRNTDIAARLFVSPKTVDHHVSALLNKLGARSRAEAAGRAAELLSDLGASEPAK